MPLKQKDTFILHYKNIEYNPPKFQFSFLDLRNKSLVPTKIVIHEPHKSCMHLKGLKIKAGSKEIINNVDKSFLLVDGVIDLSPHIGRMLENHNGDNKILFDFVTGTGNVGQKTISIDVCYTHTIGLPVFSKYLSPGMGNDELNRFLNSEMTCVPYRIIFLCNKPQQNGLKFTSKIEENDLHEIGYNVLPIEGIQKVSEKNKEKIIWDFGEISERDVRKEFCRYVKITASSDAFPMSVVIYGDQS